MKGPGAEALRAVDEIQDLEALDRRANLKSSTILLQEEGRSTLLHRSRGKFRTVVLRYGGILLTTLIPL